MKKWYLSKSIWVFGLLFVGSVLKAIGILDIPLDETATWVTIALSFIGFALRLITKEQIEW